MRQSRYNLTVFILLGFTSCDTNAAVIVQSTAITWLAVSRTLQVEHHAAVVREDFFSSSQQNAASDQRHLSRLTC